jgi:hypothetical protein
VPSLDLARLRRRLPPAPLTRFAPSPTGYLHLGHAVNAVFVWGVARALGGRVLLRLEDHDRGRCQPLYETALLEDLEWLGLEPDVGTPTELRAGPSGFRQSDCAEGSRRGPAAASASHWVPGRSGSRTGSSAGRSRSRRRNAATCCCATGWATGPISLR